MGRLTKLSTAGRVTRHQASAMSQREQRALLRHTGPPTAKPPHPAARSRGLHAADEQNASAKALTSSRARPAAPVQAKPVRACADRAQLPGGQRAKLRHRPDRVIPISLQRAVNRRQLLAGQRSKIMQPQGRHAIGKAESAPSSAWTQIRHEASAEGQGLPETREDARRLKMDQYTAVTNARKEIGIMLPSAKRSQALRSCPAPARMQRPRKAAQITARESGPVLENEQLTDLQPQQAPDTQLQTPDQGLSVLGPQMAGRLIPARAGIDMIPLASHNEALKVRSAPHQPEEAAVMEPAAASAPALPKRDRVAKVTKPCTEEGALLEAPAAMHGSAVPCDEAITCMPGRLKRVPGGDPLQVESYPSALKIATMFRVVQDKSRTAEPHLCSREFSLSTNAVQKLHVQAAFVR